MPALASRAIANFEAARTATAAGEARMGINRREMEENGDIILGGNPDGPVDHEV